MTFTKEQLAVVADALDQRIKGCNETIHELKQGEQTATIKNLIFTFETIRDRADKLAMRIDEQS